MVLSVPLSGHDVNENPGRMFETRFVRALPSAGRETLEFIYHVEFSSGLGSSIDVSDLWDDEKVIRFSRPSGQGAFKFDARTSEASQAFIDSIFSTDLNLTQPQLFGLVEDHLLEIARSARDRRRAWLKDLLDEYPGAPQLARVREAFSKAR